jgi:hypothetical protein
VPALPVSKKLGDKYDWARHYLHKFLRLHDVTSQRYTQIPSHLLTWTGQKVSTEVLGQFDRHHKSLKDSTPKDITTLRDLVDAFLKGHQENLENEWANSGRSAPTGGEDGRPRKKMKLSEKGKSHEQRKRLSPEEREERHRELD